MISHRTFFRYDFVLLPERFSDALFKCQDCWLLVTFENESFDAIGLIYAHFPAEKKSLFHKRLNTYLKPGGIVIFEAFSKNHLQYRAQNPKVGGPRNIEDLFSKEEIKTDFENFEVILLNEEEVQLNEGKYHIGLGSVLRFVGRKL